MAVGDLAESHRLRACRGNQIDDIPHFEGNAARRQHEFRRFAGHPQVLEPAVGNRLGLAVGGDNRQVGPGIATARGNQAARFNRRDTIVSTAIHVIEADGNRQFAFLGAGDVKGHGLFAGCQAGRIEGRQRRAVAVAEGDLAAAFKRIKEPCQPQRLERLARTHRTIDDIAVDDTTQACGIEGGETVVAEDRGHQPVERRGADTAIDPVSALPVRPIGPHRGQIRKIGMRAGIPGPDMDPPGIDHGAAIDG